MCALQAHTVVQLGVPLYLDQRQGDVEAYLHRVSRCGRYNQKGLNISLVLAGTEEQQLKQVYSKLELDGTDTPPHLEPGTDLSDLDKLYTAVGLLSCS